MAITRHHPRALRLLLLGAALAASATLARATTMDEALAYASPRTLTDSNLPVALVFVDPAQLCLPGQESCTPRAMPASIQQPASYVVGSTTIGTCPVEIRTGNIAIRTWLKQQNGTYRQGLSTIGFSFASIAAFNKEGVYVSAMIDLVAVPLDPTRCNASAQAGGAKELGYLQWAGNLGFVGYDGAPRISTPLNVGTQSLHKLVLGWSQQSLTLTTDDCRAPIFETPVYQGAAGLSPALFPAVTPYVTLTPAPVVLPKACDRINLSAATQGLEGARS